MWPPIEPRSSYLCLRSATCQKLKMKSDEIQDKTCATFRIKKINCSNSHRTFPLWRSYWLNLTPALRLSWLAGRAASNRSRYRSSLPIQATSSRNCVELHGTPWNLLCLIYGKYQIPENKRGLSLDFSEPGIFLTNFQTLPKICELCRILWGVSLSPRPRIKVFSQTMLQLFSPPGQRPENGGVADHG